MGCNELSIVDNIPPVNVLLLPIANFIPMLIHFRVNVNSVGVKIITTFVHTIPTVTPKAARNYRNSQFYEFTQCDWIGNQCL